MTISQKETCATIKRGRMVLCFVFFGVLSISYGCTPDATEDKSASESAKAHEGEGVTELVETDEGIPVTDSLTVQKCGSCHTSDSKGNLSRISWIRTTPEGWSRSIKRMVALNGLQLSAEDARSIVKYLGTSHGLAPEEAKQVMYMAEHRLIDEAIPNETLRQACAACHAFGQTLSWRRSKTEWALLQDTHVALFATAARQFRDPVSPTPDSDSGTPDSGDGDSVKRTQGEVALDYFSEHAPLHTPEWKEWKPRIGKQEIAGKWVVSASVRGKGRYVGEMLIRPGRAEEEFTTLTTLHPLPEGDMLTREGSGLVYAGYSWRGHSVGEPKSDTADALGSKAREAMWFSPDGKTAQGRWFWGDYQEFGFDVTLTRALIDPVVASVVPEALKAGSKGVTVQVYGSGLPATLKAQDVDLGPGVIVQEVVSASSDVVVLTVDVDPEATLGLHDVTVQGSALEQALPIYSKVDYLKVTPESNAIARLGGVTFPKGYQQFDAVGYANGPDGKSRTEDDFAIGAIDATFSVEEFPTVAGDDDIHYVGSLSKTGFFTPNVEGPNPERRFGRNNYGEIWVVATAKNTRDSLGKSLMGRSYLVVTVPMYKQYDQPEVAQ